MADFSFRLAGGYQKVCVGGHNLEIEENDQREEGYEVIDALLEKHGISPEAVLDVSSAHLLSQAILAKFSATLAGSLRSVGALAQRYFAFPTSTTSILRYRWTADLSRILEKTGRTCEGRAGRNDLWD